MQIVRLEQGAKPEPELLKRPAAYDEDTMAKALVIIKDVRERGDEAVAEYSQRFDGVAPKQRSFAVADTPEYQQALRKVDPATLAALRQAEADLRAVGHVTGELTWTEADGPLAADVTLA